MDWLKDVATARAARRSLFCLLVSLATPVFGDSANVITLSAGQPVFIDNLADSIEMLEDRTSQLDITAASAPGQPGFVRGTAANANVGFTASAWWARLTLRNT